YLKTQGRFRHLFKPENKHVIDEIQKEVDRRWQKLLKLCGIG
ncbi:MAG TPA: pyruvate ferredoxin oxidoreductase, partial [Candidatus Bathyarchaeota archaeon]|nr:pyruvate ferredoxin oxidoreductase [Candidatus Bathyarchaeota archaeon]HEX68740.1 pyruvate ferredoxin oxidoreductase [Candidatus Bathyarchaeota archaeon]